MSFRRFFQFRLSTILLLTTLCAVLFAWYVDHYSYLRREIIGRWTFPTKATPYGVLGYSSVLEIRRDGTFTKRQFYRLGEKTFSGTYTCHEDGKIVFHVTQSVWDSHYMRFLREKKRRSQDSILERIVVEPKVSKLDTTFVFFCAIDKAGHLVMDEISLSPEDDIGIKWESCDRDETDAG